MQQPSAMAAHAERASLHGNAGVCIKSARSLIVVHYMTCGADCRMRLTSVVARRGAVLVGRREEALDVCDLHIGYSHAITRQVRQMNGRCMPRWCGAVQPVQCCEAMFTTWWSEWPGMRTNVGWTSTGAGKSRRPAYISCSRRSSKSVDKPCCTGTCAVLRTRYGSRHGPPLGGLQNGGNAQQRAQSMRRRTRAVPSEGATNVGLVHR